MSVAVIPMFALKALKEFLQNILLSLVNKSDLLLLRERLMLPQEFKQNGVAQVSAGPLPPNSFCGGEWVEYISSFLNTKTSKYFEYFSVRTKAVTHLLTLELLPSHHPFPMISSLLKLMLLLGCSPKTQG